MMLFSLFLVHLLLSRMMSAMGRKATFTLDLQDKAQASNLELKTFKIIFFVCI